MILKFTFKTPSTQGIIEKICIRVAKEVDIKLGLSRDLENIYAYIEGEKDELDSFSRELAINLPVSLFLQSLDAEIVEEFIDDLDRNFPKLSLPSCPKCLKEIKEFESENFYNIFHHCEVCGYESSEKLNNEEINFSDKNERKKFFENLANKLKDGDIFIQTMNGKFQVSRDLSNTQMVVARDLASVAKYFFSFEGDAKALASIEKPILRLKTNLDFKKEFGLFTSAFDVKLPDCAVLELLFDSCNSNLLALIPSNSSTDLDFEVKVEKTPKAVVTDSDKKDILLSSGDRGILPKYEKYKKGEGKYKNYIAYGENDKTIIKSSDENIEISNPAFAGFFGVLAQWKLEEKKTLGFCFYKNAESKIFLNSPKFGLVEYLNFEFNFKSLEEVFTLIAVMDESGKKLIDNFAKKEPDFENLLNLEIKTDKKGIYYLWAIIGLILGFAKNIDEAFEKLLQYANEAMTKKGPRIDYKLQGNNLSPLWAIRTAMSFKLAGVDNNLISYGVVESFAEFLNNLYSDVNQESTLDGAVIVGDMFEGEFLNKLYTYVVKNYKVYTPKALPISGAVEAYGDLVSV